MSRGRRITPEERSRILSLFAKGETARRIHEMTGISLNPIRLIGYRTGLCPAKYTRRKDPKPKVSIIQPNPYTGHMSHLRW